MFSAHRRFAALLGAAMVLSGCVVEPHSGAQNNAPPVKESGINSKPSPATGAASNKPTAPSEIKAPPPANVAVPHAPVSGGVAYYQDSLQKALDERLVNSGIRMQRNADTIKLIVPGNLAFALNSEQIQPGFTGVLDNVALVLKEYAKTTVDIKGYTDSTGSFEHNQQLSESRAQSIGSYLLARQIAPPRVRTAGYGPRYPLAGNDTESGRHQNRRVEIELVPLP